MRLPSPMRKHSLWRIAISPELDLGVVGGARRLQAVRANNASAEAIRRMKSLCEFQHKACFPLILRGTTVDKSFDGESQTHSSWRGRLTPEALMRSAALRSWPRGWWRVSAKLMGIIL